MPLVRIVLMVALATACSSPRWSVGEEGVARVGYADWWQGCDAHCTLDAPMADGATAFVWVVDEEAMPGVTLRSEDPTVVEVESTTARDHFRLHARGTGRTRLELLDDAGSVVDRFPIEVREIDELRLIDELEQPVRLTTLERSLRFSAHGGGEQLRGFGAVRYEATPNVDLDPYDLGERSGALVGATDHLSAARGLSVERVDVRGDMSGTEGRLDVLAPSGASVSVRFDVVAPDVRSIDLRAAGGDNAVNLTAELDPEDAGEGLRACCEWSLAPPDAELYLTREECRTVRVASTMPDAPQAGVVTCRSYGAEASIAVEVYDP